MNLPVQIFPNPLITTVVEVRFTSNKESVELLPLIYSKFVSYLPTLNTNSVPKEIRDIDNRLKLQPDYVLSNDEFSLGFSNKSVVFQNIGEYKLWGNYFAFINKYLKELFDLGFIIQVDRIGVRYASILENVSVFSQALNFISGISIDGYTEKLTSYKTNLIKDDCNLFLQIAENSKAVRANQTKTGLLIDIDASFKQPISQDDTIGMIDKLHSLQKELFFKLIKPEFLQTLNPKY